MPWLTASRHGLGVQAAAKKGRNESKTGHLLSLILEKQGQHSIDPRFMEALIVKKWAISGPLCVQFGPKRLWTGWTRLKSTANTRPGVLLRYCL